jgi:phosphoribosylanthranilate isomerase
MLEIGKNVAVKVCGVTNADDALACATFGAEMLGLNFSPLSTRRISAEIAAEIIERVRPRFDKMKFVGVFVNQDLGFVREIRRTLRLDAIQLHGNESADYIRSLDGVFVIKTLRVGPDFSTATAAACDCDAILLDTWSANLAGGTGKTFSWSVAAMVRPLVKRLILAGGLTSENVGQAIRTVRPLAVDVCSGVEDATGRKSHAKVRDFIAAVRSAPSATSDLPP